MTNFERIKNMTVEEMTVFLEKFCEKDWTGNNDRGCIWCPLFAGCGEDIGDWGKWLESEVQPNEQQNF